MSHSPAPRESWGTRIGLIFAAAGNAVGIGNLLRFPGQAATHGGGAFMIPYVVSLLLFGLPMMWVAWTVGRLGGRWGHGTIPGIFDRMTGGRPWAKYAGVIGVALPMVFIIYYAYIEAWCLAYSWFSLRGTYVGDGKHVVDLAVFLDEFLGMAPTHNYFPGIGVALLFFLVTLALNVWILYRGVSGGIELLAKIAIPLLLLFCLVLGVRVLTLGTIKSSVLDGLNFLWNPDLKALLDFDVWLAAAGQIFFTLSIGFGSLEVFGSYLREHDDIALTGLTTASVNEFVEVIFGSMIAIPAAAVYFGVERVPEIASAGTYAIGMVSMPEILRGIGGVHLFGSLWFLLLFFAAFTSSVAIGQVVMSFLQDEARLSRASSAGIVGAFWLLGAFPVVFLYRYGTLDEMDFWSGTIGLVVFAIFEIVIFAWIWGIDRGWKELHKGAEITVPGFFKPIMKWVTPPLLVVIFVTWFMGAILSDSLVPRPSLHFGIEGRPEIRGTFSHHAPGPDDPGYEEFTRIEERLRGAVDEVGHDLRAWLQVTLHPSAPIAVSGYYGDPALLERVRPGELGRWLELQHFRWEPPPGEPAHSLQVTLAFEGRYRKVAIWITRVTMLAFLFTFGLMTWAIWRRRAREAAGGAA